MKLLNKLTQSVLGLGIGFTMLSTSAHAAATAAGDKYDGMVEVQDTVLGLITNGGAFTVIVLSVIVAAIAFAFKRDFSSIAIPIALGLFLSVGVNFATGLGGFTAETDEFVISHADSMIPTIK